MSAAPWGSGFHESHEESEVGEAIPVQTSSDYELSPEDREGTGPN